MSIDLTIKIKKITPAYGLFQKTSFFIKS